ncbi:MAG: DHH family phosphoesterase [Patescibacteria group bacterium]|nr:DHH family phosphoesterase [Patescibacteria group bacterium]
MFSDNDIKKFKLAGEKIDLAQKVLIISHLSPDVDAIASLCFFIDIFQRKNKYFLAWADNKNSDYYYLPNEESIVGNKEDLFLKIKNDLNKDEELSSDFLSLFDLIITLDCGSLERTSLAEEIKFIKKSDRPPFIIEIDHHAPSETYADLEIKIPLASTTELLYHLSDINNIEINRNLANCILAGILTDTANFLYPSVSSKTLEISSKMMALGAQFPKLLNSTWRNKSFLEMKIWGLALANLKVNERYNIAFSVLPYEDLNNFKKLYGNFSADIFSDIAGFLSSLSETNITMLIREEEEGKIKGSLRVGSLISDSNEEREGAKDIDVTKLAKVFGGGGHKKASGFFIEGNIVKMGEGFRVV